MFVLTVYRSALLLLLVLYKIQKNELAGLERE